MPRTVLLAVLLWTAAALVPAESAAAQRRRPPMEYPGLRWGADRAQVRAVLGREGFTQVAEDDEKGLLLASARGDTVEASFLRGRLVGVLLRELTPQTFEAAAAAWTRTHGRPSTRLGQNWRWARGDTSVAVFATSYTAGRVLYFGWQGPGYDTRPLGVLEDRRRYAQKQRGAEAAWVRARVDTTAWQIVHVTPGVAVSLERGPAAKEAGGVQRLHVRWDYASPYTDLDGTTFTTRRFRQRVRCGSHETSDGGGEWLHGTTVVKSDEGVPFGPWERPDSEYTTVYHAVRRICGYLWLMEQPV